MLGSFCKVYRFSTFEKEEKTDGVRRGRPKGALEIGGALCLDEGGEFRAFFSLPSNWS